MKRGDGESLPRQSLDARLKRTWMLPRRVMRRLTPVCRPSLNGPLYEKPLLRGPTPFEDMIFYLWTDSNEICTAYVKLKINHILFVKNF